MFAALRAFDGQVSISAVTAPGVDVLPWDEAHCAGLGEHRHSGLLGCRVQSDPALAWSGRGGRLVRERWRKLNSAARVATQRQTGCAPVLLLRVWQLQARGVWHVHPVVGWRTAREKHAARVYLDALARLAPSFGFGHVERRLDGRPGEAAAGYLSKYLIRGKRGESIDLDVTVMSEGMRSVVYARPELTQASGLNMRELRYRRFVWAVAGGLVKLDAGLARSVADRTRELGRALTEAELAAMVVEWFTAAQLAMRVAELMAHESAQLVPQPA
jgi:hypothetical protein